MALRGRRDNRTTRKRAISRRRDPRRHAVRRPFTPKHADHVRVAIAGGATPWPILRRLLELVESSGDIVEEHEAPSGVGDKLLSNNVWWYAGTAFEVSSFHVSDRDAWCYELCEVKPDAPSNNYVEVEIPEMAPAAAGPFIAEPADRVTLTGHGGWDIPWPIFRRFISAITASGDIAEDQTAAEQASTR